MLFSRLLCPSSEAEGSYTKWALCPSALSSYPTFPHLPFYFLGTVREFRFNRGVFLRAHTYNGQTMKATARKFHLVLIRMCVTLLHNSGERFFAIWKSLIIPFCHKISFFLSVCMVSTGFPMKKRKQITRLFHSTTNEPFLCCSTWANVGTFISRPAYS